MKLFFSQIILFLFISTASSSLLHAQGSAIPPEYLKLDWVIEQALQRNPQIQAAEWRWHAVEQREPQISSLDDPVLSYSRWLSTPETRVGPQENVLMLAQRIPFFGKLSLKGEMASHEALAAEQQYHATRRDIIYKVKTVYYDLYWIDNSLSILNEYQDVLRSFMKVAEGKYRTGIGIQANVLKADLEISAIEERKLNFIKMRRGTSARLNALLNREPQSPLDSPGPLDTSEVPIDTTRILQAALNRQELQEVQAMIRRSEAGVSLARRNYFPDFVLLANYVTIPDGRTSALDSGKDPYGIQIGLTVPLWFGKLSAALDEAKAHEQSLQLSYRDLHNQIAAEVMDVLARLRAAHETVSLYDQQIIPDAERTLASALSSYQTGTLDFLSLLDSERMLLNFRLARAKELANYWKQVAALERAVGGTLP